MSRDSVLKGQSEVLQCFDLGKRETRKLHGEGRARDGKGGPKARWGWSIHPKPRAATASLTGGLNPGRKKVILLTLVNSHSREMESLLPYEGEAAIFNGQ